MQFQSQAGKMWICAASLSKMDWVILKLFNFLIKFFKFLISSLFLIYKFIISFIFFIYSSFILFIILYLLNIKSCFVIIWLFDEHCTSSNWSHSFIHSSMGCILRGWPDTEMIPVLFRCPCCLEQHAGLWNISLGRDESEGQAFSIWKTTFMDLTAHFESNERLKFGFNS